MSPEAIFVEEVWTRFIVPGVLLMFALIAWVVAILVLFGDAREVPMSLQETFEAEEVLNRVRRILEEEKSRRGDDRRPERVRRLPRDEDSGRFGFLRRWLRRGRADVQHPDGEPDAEAGPGPLRRLRRDPSDDPQRGVRDLRVDFDDGKARDLEHEKQRRTSVWTAPGAVSRR